MTVKEQYEFLLLLAHIEHKQGEDFRCRQLLECAATIQELWMDMKEELILDFTDNHIPTCKSIQKISSAYCRKTESKKEIY